MGMWGNITAYGLAPMTGGLSLLGKKSIRNATGASSLTGEAQADAASKAAQRQTAAGQEANGILKQYLDQVRQDQAPYQQAGIEGLSALKNAEQNGEFVPKAFNYQDPGEFQSPGNYQEQAFNFQADPGYQFRLNQGVGAIQNKAAAGGALRSGATLKALMNYGQGAASDEYGNAYNRYSQDRTFGANQFNGNRDFAANQWNGNRAFGYGAATDQYNRGAGESQNRFTRLSQLAGYGQNANAANQQAGGAYAQGAGNNLMGIANAQGAAGMYGADARAQGTQNLLGFGGTLAGMAFGGMGNPFARQAMPQQNNMPINYTPGYTPKNYG